MKKILSAGIALTMVLMATGCNGKKEAAPVAKKAAAPAEEKSIQLIVAHNQTSLENPYAYAINKFKEVAEAESGGKIKVVCHHGTMGENENELVEKLDMNALQLCVVSPGFMAAIGVPEVNIFALPYLFDSFQHWEKCLDGKFGTALKDVVLQKTQNRYRIMGYWTASVRDYYGKKPIKSPADLKGMTIRTQNSKVQVDFWKGCGAIPTNVAWGELYQALQQGVVDSAENDYTNFMLKEHHKTANGKYVCETHHDFTTRLFLMNGNFYDKLTEKQKEWINKAALAATQEDRKVTYSMSDSSKAKVIADGGVVTDFKDMDIAAFKNIAVKIQDDFASENKMTTYIDMVRNAAK